MGSIKYIIILLALSIVACGPPANDEEPSQGPEGNLFIIGGGSRSLELMKELVNLAPANNPYILILSQSSGEPDTSFYYVARQFTELTPAELIHLDSAGVVDFDLDSIVNAGLIYITGGDQNRFMRNVPANAQQAIRDAYNNGATIAGTSAGAALMSRIMITGDQLLEEEYSATYPWLNFENGIYAEGLGLTDSLVIDQHFVARSRYNRILSAMADKSLPYGAGIDESTALIIEPAFSRVAGDGQVLIFEKPEVFTNHNNRIGFKNLRVSAYLPGDTININFR